MAWHINLAVVERGDFLDNATHAAAAEFEKCGVKLTVDEMYRINDLLTEILGNRTPKIPPP
jgi:hypothetical protein